MKLMEDKSESILQEEKDHAKKEEATEVAVVTVQVVALLRDINMVLCKMIFTEVIHKMLRE